jgi:hypothetical protein
MCFFQGMKMDKVASIFKKQTAQTEGRRQGHQLEAAGAAG